MQDEIASQDAKQRGDKGKCREFAGGTGPDDCADFQSSQHFAAPARFQGSFRPDETIMPKTHPRWQ
jgi:hypothetical protein